MSDTATDDGFQAFVLVILFALGIGAFIAIQKHTSAHTHDATGKAVWVDTEEAE